MKEFNLQEAKAGEPVCTRDGKDARIICFDGKGCTPITALVDFYGDEVCFQYASNGRFHPTINKEIKLDLMMKSKKCKGWINIYRYKGYSRRTGFYVYKTKEDALKNCGMDYISTVEIEWEE